MGFAAFFGFWSGHRGKEQHIFQLLYCFGAVEMLVGTFELFSSEQNVFLSTRVKIRITVSRNTSVVITNLLCCAKPSTNQ